MQSALVLAESSWSTARVASRPPDLPTAGSTVRIAYVVVFDMTRFSQFTCFLLLAFYSNPVSLPPFPSLFDAEWIFDASGRW